MIIDITSWDYIFGIVFVVTCMTHFYRIYAIIFKYSYAESRGYISNNLTKMHLVVESGAWIIFLVMLTIKEYLRINNMFHLYENAYDKVYLAIVVIMLSNYFIVTRFIRKYKITKQTSP